MARQADSAKPQVNAENIQKNVRTGNDVRTKNGVRAESGAQVASAEKGVPGMQAPPSVRPEEPDRTLGGALRASSWGVRLGSALLFTGVALLVGLTAGALIVLALRLSSALQTMVWHNLSAALPPLAQTLFPLVACVIGGVLIGAYTSRAGFTLCGMGEVIRRCRTQGGYSFPSWGRAVVLFLLPIAFGGAVGPEAGVSGFVAAVLTQAIHALRRSGYAVIDNPEGPLGSAVRALSPSAEGKEFKLRVRWVRIVLWLVAVAGIIVGASCTSTLLGGSEGMPRIAAIDYARGAWLSALPAFILGIAVALLVAVASKAARRLSNALERVAHGERSAHILRATVCGAALGLAAIFMPDVLFSGETGLEALIGSWATYGLGLLAATVVAKMVLTQLCVSMDWVGGEFFPLIYCGAATGYVVALLMGCDPMVAVAVSAGALVSAATTKPLLATAVLAICFPVQSLPVVAASAFLAAGVRRMADRR